MKKLFFLSFILLSISILSQEPSFYLRYGKWKNNLGNTTLTFSNLVELGKDMGLEDKSSNTWGFLYRGLKHRFSFELFSSTLKENIVLDKDIEFGGTTFNKGQEVETYFKVEIKEFEYWYPVFSTPLFRTGIILGVDQIKTKSMIEEVSVKTDETFPYIGFGNTIISPRSKVYIDILLTATQYKDITSMNGKIETGLDITSSIGLYMGLKKVKIEIEDKSSYNLDFDMASFYVGAYLRF
ncbi:MAG: hypothetical protein WHV67_04230 [Thermoanaerobaculia bacterium]